MFEIAGTSICVGNGREKAKKQASYVTKPVSEDGIEYALKHFKRVCQEKCVSNLNITKK